MWDCWGHFPTFVSTRQVDEKLAQTIQQLFPLDRSVCVDLTTCISVRSKEIAFFEKVHPHGQCVTGSGRAGKDGHFHIRAVTFF